MCLAVQLCAPESSCIMLVCVVYTQHLLHTLPSPLPTHTHTHPHSPNSYFLSLALTPSAMIGLDSTLRAPKLELNCACKPSLYAYPAPVTTGGLVGCVCRSVYVCVPGMEE